jgi:hypothetical protein
MRLVAAPLGLLLALVIAVLAVPQVVTMETTFLATESDNDNVRFIPILVHAVW